MKQTMTVEEAEREDTKPVFDKCQKKKKKLIHCNGEQKTRQSWLQVVCQESTVW